MEEVEKALGSVIYNLNDANYARSLASCRSLFKIGQTHYRFPSDLIFDAIWNNRPIIVPSRALSRGGGLIHRNSHLIVCFASDAESDHVLAPYSSGLQSRLCARSLQEFFSYNIGGAWSMEVAGYWNDDLKGSFYADTNLVAHWANHGCVEESTIRSHILQSLIDISHPTLRNYQAQALIILFKVAGATFEAHADPSVVDRCFELLKDHRNREWPPDSNEDYQAWKGNLVKEVVALRESGWKGLPPPPVFTTRKQKPTGVDRKDPAATPVVTSLGLPNCDLGSRSPRAPSLGLGTREPETIPESPVTPVAQSPSISIATLSDFTIADTTDDESPTDTSDDELPTDATASTPHETFYLEDGNVEVLCGSTLFRVHTTILSFHSPALRQMFAQTSLATANSPNGCPRILSSDTARDFAALLKMIYLPGFPERNKVPDFATFSSLLRITAKYEMPAIRSQLLEVVRDAYPENFEGLNSSKPLGESVFSGRTPHPNEVLNLFVQQKLASALPMAYYMATRRGPDSLVDRYLPRNTTLPPEVLQPAIKGLMALREVELNETHRLLFHPKSTCSCSASGCLLHTPTSPAALDACQTVFDRIVGSSRFGTNLLQVPKFHMESRGDFQSVGGICRSCVERWESGHAELRKKAWAMLPDVFGLKG